MRYTSTFFICGYILLALTSGCVPSPARYYIAGYTVTTATAKNPEFRETVKKVGIQISKEVQYPIEYQNDRPAGVLIELQCNKTNAGRPPRILIDWSNVNRDWFSINVVKNGAEDSEEVLRAQAVVEKVLKQHPDFTWKYELNHRTMAR